MHEKKVHYLKSQRYLSSFEKNTQHYSRKHLTLGYIVVTIFSHWLDRKSTFGKHVIFLVERLLLRIIEYQQSRQPLMSSLVSESQRLSQESSEEGLDTTLLTYPAVFYSEKCPQRPVNVPYQIRALQSQTQQRLAISLEKRPRKSNFRPLKDESSKAGRR